MMLRWYHFVPLSFTVVGLATENPSVPVEFRGVWTSQAECTKDNALVISARDYSVPEYFCKVNAVTTFDKLTSLGKAVAITLECYRNGNHVDVEQIRTLIVDKDELMDVGPEGDIDYYKRCVVSPLRKEV